MHNTLNFNTKMHYKLLMLLIRDILNEIKWTKDLKNVEIFYIHRGALNNTKVLSGKDIVNIEKSSLDAKTATIPYHRIFKII